MLTPEQRRRVLAIYAAADAAVAAAGPRCDASGRCCRFTEYGHTLFISQLEADVLLADGDPQAGTPPFDGPITRDFCPFQVNNLCTAREIRPLGCRVYFCDPAYQETGERISETYLRQLKDLADELGVGWRYAPLHEFLEEALARMDRRPNPPGPPSRHGKGAGGLGSAPRLVLPLVME
jgi:Fe-S-cluster containining protein